MDLRYQEWLDPAAGDHPMIRTAQRMISTRLQESVALPQENAEVRIQDDYYCPYYHNYLYFIPNNVLKSCRT